MTNSPTPKCATAMEIMVREYPRRDFLRHQYLTGSMKATAITQHPNRMPMNFMMPNWRYTTNGTISANRNVARANGQSLPLSWLQSVFFQVECMPMPINSTSGNVGMMKTVLKYGGPTEILPRPSPSRNSGYSVPNRISSVATTNSMLFASRKVS